MFGWLKPKGKTKPVAPVSDRAGKKLSREEIIALAKARAAAAREEIGDETLEKIREAMLRKENSPFEQAKRKVKAMDDEHVRYHVSDWLKDK